MWTGQVFVLDCRIVLRFEEIKLLKPETIIKQPRAAVESKSSNTLLILWDVNVVATAHGIDVGQVKRNCFYPNDHSFGEVNCIHG